MPPLISLRVRGRLAGVRRSALAACVASSCAITAPGPVAAQQRGESAVPGIFEIERPRSFAGEAVGSPGLAAPSTDPSVLLARYHHVTRTLGGSLAGALSGAVMVIVVCSYAAEVPEEKSPKFLDFGGCYNRDRWFGFVAGGSLLGTVLGGGQGASLTGGRLGRLSPLRSTECSFREGVRRALMGAAIGSIPALAHYASGGDGLDILLVAPAFQGGGALIATWGCIIQPRLGPIGPSPMP